MQAQDILPKLDNVKQTGPGKWVACCPAHDDDNPSLSIRQDGEKLLLHCFAGCTYDEIMAAVTGHTASASGKKSSAKKAPPPWERPIETIYNYTDLQGKMVFQKLRFGDGLAPKYMIRKPRGSSWAWRLGDTIPVLYNLPAVATLQQSDEVFIVEGEKDADRLISLGLTATCNFDGSSKPGKKQKWKPDLYNQYLTGLMVYILADNDPPGHAHAAHIAQTLVNQAAQVKIVNLPGLGHKQDVSDWLDMGHTLEELREECYRATPVTVTPEIPIEYPPVRIDEKLPKASLTFILDCLRDEELGDARLLANIYTDRIVYDHSYKNGAGWFFWSGHYWQADNTQQIRLIFSGPIAAQYLRAAADLRQQATIASSQGNQEEADRLANLETLAVKRAYKLRTLRRTNNALTYATSYVGITGEAWDTKPTLLAVKNGVLDLTTGELHIGQPNDYLKTVAPTEWQGIDAPAPRWERFILEIMGHDEEMAEFLQRLLGYAISGLAAEHILPIFWGADGRNGKDTLLDTLKYVLGDLADSINKDAILFNKYRSQGAASPQIYALKGKRLVWVSEPDEGARLDAGQVKLITGGGRMRARQLYHSEISWEPTHTLILVTNPKPHMTAEDNALWERIRLIPFTQRFIHNPKLPNEYKADTQLKEKLKEEDAGILAWLVRGFLKWQINGLAAPDIVTEVTKAYRQEEDTLGMFVSERCQVGENESVTGGEFYKSYLKWCEVNNLRPMTGTTFGKKMSKRFPKTRSNGGVLYSGITLIPDETVQPELNLEDIKV